MGGALGYDVVLPRQTYGVACPCRKLSHVRHHACDCTSNTWPRRRLRLGFRRRSGGYEGPRRHTLWRDGQRVWLRAHHAVGPSCSGCLSWVLLQWGGANTASVVIGSRYIPYPWGHRGDKEEAAARCELEAGMLSAASVVVTNRCSWPGTVAWCSNGGGGQQQHNALQCSGGVHTLVAGVLHTHACSQYQL